MKKPSYPIYAQAILILALLFLPFAASSAIYTVTNTNDVGAGSLRQAILDANANPGADVIAFNIGGGGAQVIDVQFNALPIVGADLTIDGTTQPGYSGTPLIEVRAATLAIFRVNSNFWIKGVAMRSTNLFPTNPVIGIFRETTLSNLKVEQCRFSELCRGISVEGSDIQIIDCTFDYSGVLECSDAAAIELGNVQENVIPKGVLAYGNKFNMQYNGNGDIPVFYSLYQISDLLIGNAAVPGANIIVEDNAGFDVSTATCFKLLWSDDVIFDNLQMVKVGDPPAFGGISIAESKNVIVRNCVSSNIIEALNINQSQDIQVLDNTFSNCGLDDNPFIRVFISDLGSNLLPNGFLMDGNQFSDIGYGIALSADDDLSLIVGSPATPNANIVLTDSDGHNDIQNAAIWTGYEGGGLANFTIRDLDFFGPGSKEGFGLLIGANTLVENCRISNYEFGLLYVGGGATTAQCNLIYNNSNGIVRYNTGTDLIENNTIVDNNLAVDNTYILATPLTAENNYWGGGAPPLNGPNGYIGDVDADPFLTVPPGCAPTIPPPEPEIDLSGNSQPIPNGSAIPDLNNHTYFGTVTSPLTRTFTIENTGDADLTISSIVSDTSVFVVGALTPASPIAPGNSATFDVTFVPNQAGLLSGTISIDNNDSDENPYVFAVSGVAQTIASGKVIWENDGATGVGNVAVALTGHQSASAVTPADGTYSFTIIVGSDFEITPTKNINKTNGLTVVDATAIQKHIAGVMPITDPYKLVAADVNKSNSVTTLDVVILNQSLLGNPAALNQFKTSWRFVPVAHTMNIPPWGFPEKIVLTGVSGNVPDQDFFGIKTGDIVTAFANPANFGAGKSLVLNVHDQVLQTGSEVLTEFRASQLEDLAAFQFALHFDPAQLQLAALTTADGGALPLTMDNFGLYHVSEGEIRAVWSQAEGLFVEEATSVFSLKFNVLEGGGKLSEALSLDEDALPGYAYNSALAESGVQLNFLGTTGAGSPASAGGLQLLQNQPNPFNGTTTIGFVLPEACELQLRIFDTAGRLITERRAQYPAGGHAERFDLENATGVLYYELVTPFGILAKKMTVIGE